MNEFDDIVVNAKKAAIKAAAEKAEAQLAQQNAAAAKKQELKRLIGTVVMPMLNRAREALERNGINATTELNEESYTKFALLTVKLERGLRVVLRIELDGPEKVRGVIQRPDQVIEDRKFDLQMPIGDSLKEHVANFISKAVA